MASERGRRRRARVATLAVLALMLQALSGLLPGAGSATPAPAPWGALVICTPDGVRILGPDGEPLETPEGGVPAAAADPCLACCLSETCCQGHTGAKTTEVFATAAAPAFAKYGPAAAYRPYDRANPSRGPPESRTLSQTL